MQDCDYYRLLELKDGASEEEICESYRRLSKLYHPDSCKSVNSVDLFIMLTEAYNSLRSRIRSEATDDDTAIGNQTSDRFTPNGIKADSYSVSYSQGIGCHSEPVYNIPLGKRFDRYC